MSLLQSEFCGKMKQKLNEVGFVIINKYNAIQIFLGNVAYSSMRVHVYSSMCVRVYSSMCVRV